MTLEKFVSRLTLKLKVVLSDPKNKFLLTLEKYALSGP